MLLFFTRSTQHLQSRINLPTAHTEIKQFSDGELYVKINQSISDKKIWVITETGAPAENMLELFFLLNTLVRNGASKINILFTYFGYARQAQAEPHEAASAQAICNILKMFPLEKISIIHVHDLKTMKTLLNFTNKIDYNFFIDAASNIDLIAAPDEGAAEFATKVAQITNKSGIFINKMRPEQEKVKIQSVTGKSVYNKNVLLVDDIISTGNTLIKASLTLKERGARTISAAVTHGIFSQETINKLKKNFLDAIYVTNTLKQYIDNNFLKIWDIAPFIDTLLKHEN